MSEFTRQPPAIEPERYELHESPLYHFGVARRDFFRSMGAGVLLLLSSPSLPAQQESVGGRGRGAAVPQDVAAWLHIGEDGTISIFTGKAEVGQNIRTSLSQVVADELRLPLSSIRLVMADTDLTPYDMGTFGSRTSPIMAPQLRRVAAAAREYLIERAADRWKVDRAGLRVEAGRVVDAGGNRILSFAELTKGEKIVKVVDPKVATMPAAEWKIAGSSPQKIGGRDMVTGRHRFTTDIRNTGMLHGKVLRAPAFNSTIASVDAGKAEALPGVVVVREGEFVAVAAPSQEEAARALGAIEVTWNSPAQPSGKELFDILRAGSGPEGGQSGGGGRPGRGSIEQGMAAADKKIRAGYTVAFIAHAPLEPRAAVAEWSGGRLTVWTGTQRPFGVRSELARAFRLTDDRVRVIVPDTGSGYGGKHSAEAAIEAARIAKSAGRPVKLVWSREEEFTWAYFRPAGVIEVSSGVRNDGTITAWEFHNYNSGSSAIATLYDVPNQRIEFHAARSPLRQGSYRALAATANHFARESHMDELAIAVGIDPLEFRLKNLKDPRLRAVLEAAAEHFGWRKAKPSPGRGFGIAGGFEKGSYISTCAEVAVEKPSGRIRILRLVSAYECGAILNPNHLRNQVEGAIVQGIGGALFEEIEFENGRILNGRFSRYRVPRFSDTPPIETVLLDRKDLPSAGAGETPIVALAPAVANAVFAASGVRVRSLPMRSAIAATETAAR